MDHESEVKRVFLDLLQFGQILFVYLLLGGLALFVDDQIDLWNVESLRFRVVVVETALDSLCVDVAGKIRQFSGILLKLF